MRTFKYIVVLLVLVSCHSGSKKKDQQIQGADAEIVKQKMMTISKTDSIEILQLIRKVYEWNSKNSKPYFNIGLEDDTKEKYIGIDWNKFESNASALKSTGNFSDIFIENYKKTLVIIDEKVKNGNYEDGWFVGYYPPFGTGANEWCHCQDVPSDDYWTKMEISSITPKANSVKIVWNWGEDVEWEWLSDVKGGYPIEVVKESGVWKISYLDGFDKRYY